MIAVGAFDQTDPDTVNTIKLKLGAGHLAGAFANGLVIYFAGNLDGALIEQPIVVSGCGDTHRTPVLERVFRCTPLAGRRPRPFALAGIASVCGKLSFARPRPLGLTMLADDIATLLRDVYFSVAATLIQSICRCAQTSSHRQPIASVRQATWHSRTRQLRGRRWSS